MKSAARVIEPDDEDGVEGELAAWRDEIRRHALIQLARKTAKPPRSLRIGLLTALIALLFVLLFGLRSEMRPGPLSDEITIQVMLIDESQPEPRPPIPAPMPVPRTLRAIAPKPVEPHAVVAPEIPLPESAAVETAPDYRVFNPDGSVIIPSDSHRAAAAGMQASFIAQSTASPPIMHHQRPLKVRPNHFAQSWLAAPGESLLGSFVREHLTAETEFVTPWGTHVKCGVVVFMGGCSWGPPPVWKPSHSWQPASALDEE